MSTQRVALLALLIALPGCREVFTCAGINTAYIGGQCVALDDSGPQMPDTGIDSGHDGGADAPDLCASCTASGQMCTLGRDAGMTTPLCVECFQDSDCTTRVDAGPDDAGPAAGTPICLNNRCQLGCENAGDCGRNPCRTNHMCSAYPIYPAATCRPCDTDANCAPGLYCVPYAFADGAFTHTGSYCLVESGTGPAGECGSPTRPLSHYAISGGATTSTSADGHSAIFCAPTTSCEALVEASQATLQNCMTEPTDCGLAGATDAVCASGRCTIACLSADDCPLGRSCGTTNICQ